ncbi:MAG: prolyl oligopeptidase family serine peptidase [Pseudomonadales bacterium]
MKRFCTLRALCAIFAQLLLILTAATALAKSPLQLQDMHKLATVSEPAFSPDGRTLVYTVETQNIEDDSSSSNLFTLEFSKRKQQVLGNTPDSSEWAAQFTADGQHIVFLSDRGEQETTQVWMMPAAGGIAVNLSKWSEDVQDYSLSPDGKYLAYVSVEADDDLTEIDEDATPPPVVTERFYFKEDYSGYLDEKRSRIFVRTISDGSITVIGKTDRNTWLPSWSPDSSQLAYVEKTGEKADRHFNYDVYVQALTQAAESENTNAPLPAPRQVSQFSGVDADPYWMVRPQWSPSGRKLLWLQGEESKWIYYAPLQLVMANLDTGKVSKLAWQDRWMNQPLWSEDGKSVYAIVEESREAHVQQINVATGSISYLSAGPQFISAIALGKDDRLVALSSSDEKPAELYSLEGARQRQLSNHNEWLTEKTLLAAENIAFENDGATIHGFITKPAGEMPAEGYPTVVELHGGPVYQYSREFSFDRQMYASNGYLVVSINPRGSSGHGFDFARAIYADWGNKDSSDILAGLNDLQAKGLVDPNRIGLEGWSYGGMLTHYLIARDTRFKAAVSGAGATNVFATFGHDMYIREYLFELGAPWENMAAYQRLSQPFLEANKIKTPTLFQCAELDYNVPCIGAEQMFQSLKILDIPTRLVIYPKQYHGLDIPSYMEDRMQRNLNWFKQYLQVNEPDDPAL